MSPGLLLQVLAEADEQPRPVDTAPGCHLVAFPLGVSREACGAGLWAQNAPRDHTAHRRWSRAPVLTFHGIQPAHVASSLSLDLLSLPCADGRLLGVRGALPHLSSQASWRGAGHTAGAPERGLRAQNLKNFKAALPSAGVGGGLLVERQQRPPLLSGSPSQRPRESLGLQCWTLHTTPLGSEWGSRSL